MAGNIYHSWNGTVLTITSDSGTSSANLKGDDGARGAQGVAGGTCYNVCVAPTNIFDNSNWSNPINQRGEISGYINWQYFIDRWILGATDASQVYFDINTQYQSIGVSTETGADIYLIQRFPLGIIKKNQIYTLAYETLEGNIVIVHVSAFEETASFTQAVIQVKSNTYIKWVAMYEGTYTADTLPAYQYKGYAAELAECQRYYIKIATQPINGWCYNWGRVSAFVPTPVQMRTAYPTVTSSNSNFYVGSTSYNAALDGGTSVNNGVVIYYTHTAAINGQCVIPEFAAEINADL